MCRCVRPYEQNEVGVLKIADFGLSKSLRLPKPKRHGNSSLDNSLSTTVNGGSPHGGGGAQGGGQEGQAHGPAYKLTGETGSYR